MSTVKFTLRLVLPLFLIIVVAAGALGGINAITEDRIADAQAEKVQQAIAQVLPDAGQLRPVSFKAEEHPQVVSVYGAASGYAVEVETAGFGGGIRMMVGVGKDGRVLGIQIIRHTETAGLGAVAGASTGKGQAFRDSFAGLSAPVTVSKDGGEADTITGATITSRAVADGINAALCCVENLGLEVQP